MASRARTIRQEDALAWEAYARHVRRLPGRPAPENPSVAARPPPTAAPVLVAATPTTKKSTSFIPQLAVGTAPGGLDAASWRRFRSGDLVPERRIDLHGRTTQAAFMVLGRFLEQARADGVRCVEIITGHGSRTGGGAIRRELPLWLNLAGVRATVLAASHPERNPGAVRVLLRRVRSR